MSYENTDILDTMPEDRPVKQALRRGWARQCPNCGAGPMFEGYLTVRHSCDLCEQELHHHRADDGPAYVTILICGHLLAPLILFAFENLDWEPLSLVVVFSIGFVALALYLLPRIKGAFVALQWAKRMHGFGR